MYITIFARDWQRYKLHNNLQVASSLSDTLGNLNMDNVHNERRDRLRNNVQSSSGHLVAGVKGFGYGLFGALTSIITQPVQGYKEEGVEVSSEIL